MAGGQKRGVGLLLLFVVLAALATYIWLVEFPREEVLRERSAQAHRFLGVDPRSASTVVVESGETAIELTRSASGQWKIISPLNTQADQRAVETLLSRLHESRLTRVIATEPTNLEPFGLAPAELAVTYIVDGLQHRIEFGQSSPVGASAYVRYIRPVTEPGQVGALASFEPIMLVPQSLKDAMNRTLFDLRRKEVLDFSVETVSAVELRYGDQAMPTLRVERQQPTDAENLDQTDEGIQWGPWRLAGPIDETADEEVVEEVIEKLHSLRALSILDEGKAEKLAELTTPRTVVSIATPGGSQEVALYFPFGDETAFAVTTPDAPLYEVDRQIVLQFDKSLFDFQDKRVAAIRPETVRAIEVALPERTYRLVKEGERWRYQGQLLSPEGSGKIDVFVNVLKDATVEKVASRSTSAWPGLGLDDSATTVTIEDQESSADPWIVRLGKREGDLLYVRRGTAPDSYITDALLITELPTIQALQSLVESQVSSPERLLSTEPAEPMK